MWDQPIPVLPPCKIGWLRGAHPPGYGNLRTHTQNLAEFDHVRSATLNGKQQYHAPEEVRMLTA